MIASSFDLALILASVAGLGILLVAAGIHQLTYREVSLSDRLAGYELGGRRLSTDEPATRLSLARQLESALEKRSFTAGLQREIARANLRLTAGEFLLIQVGAVLGGFALGSLASSPISGAALAALGYFCPRVFLTFKQRTRLKAFGTQLADTLMLMSNSLRAGYSLLQSMETVAREGAQPTADEFSRVVREVGLGLTPEQALINLYRRIPSEDLDLMVTAINVQHEVGGNLAKIFDTLAETIRERGRVHGEIMTLTAQQRLGGMVISLLPVALAAGLFLMNPSFFNPLLSSQTVICVPAFALPMGAAAMVVFGYAAIRKITAIEV